MAKDCPQRMGGGQQQADAPGGVRGQAKARSQDSGCKGISGKASGCQWRLATPFRKAPVHRVLDGVSEVADQGMRDVFAKLEARTPRSSKWWARVSKSKIQRRNKFS